MRSTPPGGRIRDAVLAVTITLLGSELAAAAVRQDPAPKGDPREGEVILQRRAGWTAALIWQGEVGVWTVESYPIFPQYGCSEVVGLDDKGRCLVLVSYSGKWTPKETLREGTWLGGLAFADVDPRVEGRELYTGGHSGNLFRIITHPEPRGGARLESVEIAHFPAEDIHTIAGGDLLPSRPGEELIVFTGAGNAYEVRASLAGGGSKAAAFATKLLAPLPGRVRDVVVLPAHPGDAPWIAAVCRSQELLLLRLDEDGLEQRVLAREGMGMGRVSMAPHDPAHPEAPIVLYATRDDGLILRFEQRGTEWVRERIYAGPQGPRGIAAGRFHADSAVETVAVFGYSRRVELISRHPGQPWKVETIYVDGEKGHWLQTAELDGRNGTHELIASGFGGRIVLLGREPGYGLGAIPADSQAPRKAAHPVRIAVKASSTAVEELSPLNYQGGFETKSLVYETLVRRDARGHIVPGLATSWTIGDGGRRFLFTLREGATFHDGRPVTPADVALHFRRWVGLPEHGWLHCNKRITNVRAMDERRLEVVLDQPYALLADLCSINPCAIRGPGAIDREGNHVRPIGTGPYRFAEVRERGRVMRYERHPGYPNAKLPPVLDLVRFEKTPADDPLDAFLRGEVDVILGSWLMRLDPARVESLRSHPDVQVVDGPGSCMVILMFEARSGPCANRALRQRVATAIDRDALIAEVEHGLADASTGWAAPALTIWPQGRTPEVEHGSQPPKLERPLRIHGGRAGYVHPRLVEAIATQLRAASMPVEVVEPPREDVDLRLEITHGSPYDPWTTLVSRFGPRTRGPSAEAVLASRRSGDDRLADLVERAMRAADEKRRFAIYGEIQANFDEEVWFVPLYAPRRLAIVRAGLPLPTLTADMYSLDVSFLAQVE